MKEKDLMIRFDEKLRELEEKLPKLKINANCAELTLTSVLDVLGVDDYMFHNIAMPLAGGFGGYKSKKGWMGACGAVAGGCAALGAIMGGHEKMDSITMATAYLKASKYASEFEKEFGSVICSELCNYDFSQPEGFLDYRRNKVWETKCYKFVIWAVDKVRKLTRKALKRKWE